MNIGALELFCDVDGYCLSFEQCDYHRQPGAAVAEPGPKPRLALSEIMTIAIYFHVSHYRSFRSYTKHVMMHWRAEFPGCIIWPMPTSDSGARCPLVPTDADHLSDGMSSTNEGMIGIDG